MKSILFISLLLVSSMNAAAQFMITGRVIDQENQVVPGASILIEGTQNGTTSDESGNFFLNAKQQSTRVIVSFIGFDADTLTISSGDPVTIVLKESSVKLDEVVVRSAAVFLDKMDPMHQEVITEKELAKAACCNLSESFETNASVDVSYSDAVTGTRTLQMLGLAGKYVTINRENMPYLRGLFNANGLSYVPGPWIQSIDVGKGAGTVVNGYESMSGQINLELKKPESSEKWYLNGYLNSFGKVDFNVNYSGNLGSKWSTAVLLHGDYLASEIDRNDDGFMDLPKTRQVNLLNRYKYTSEHVVSQIGFQLMLDDKAGGQTGFGFDDDLLTSEVYGYANQTRRFEVFGKTGLLFPDKPYRGWGFLYSLSRTEMNGGAGRREYRGENNTAYGNVIYQNIIGNSFHQYRTGVSFLYDGYDESFVDSTFSRDEVVPGIYYEYSYLPGDQFSLVAGLRTDFHNLYGTYWTPRLHLRWQPGKLTFRASAGRGYRTPNVIPENNQTLVSSRRLIVEEEVKPEETWNFGGSISGDYSILGKQVGLVADYFYTTFENQLIYDMDQSSDALYVYNLDGRAFAHSLQFEGNVSLNDFLQMKLAYKYYNVQSTINGRLREMPYVPRNRFFVNFGYASKFDKWTADVTLQWIGRKRLPDTSDKPAEFQRQSYSDDFVLVNAQVSRGFRWGSIYLGSENLFNYKQEDPIIDPENPFGDQFDASIVWAPIAGQLIYTGIRFKVK